MVDFQHGLVSVFQLKRGNLLQNALCLRRAQVVSAGGGAVARRAAARLPPHLRLSG